MDYLMAISILSIIFQIGLKQKNCYKFIVLHDAKRIVPSVAEAALNGLPERDYI